MNCETKILLRDKFPTRTIQGEFMRKDLYIQLPFLKLSNMSSEHLAFHYHLAK